MIFTEDDKAFVKIFVPRLWTTESYERIPWQKTKYVWIGQPYSIGIVLQLITKLLKWGISKRTHGVASPTVRKPNERHDRYIRIKACMLVNAGYFDHRMRC